MGCFNAGEKIMFWFAQDAGVLAAISGYPLMSRFYGTNILGMQGPQVMHRPSRHVN